LKVNDITFKGPAKGKICVRKGKGYKPGDPPAYVTLLEDDTNKVDRYVKSENKGSDDFLITNRFNKPYKSGCSLNLTLKRYCIKADIKDWKKMHTHTFRHMFGTRTYERCGMETTQAMMRHKNSTTT